MATSASELREKTVDQLTEQLTTLKKEAFNLRFQQATNQLENTARMRAVRRDVVSVERRFTHPVLKKTIRKSKKYRAHDPADAYKVGDVVRIEECAPVSKTKRWIVVSKRNLDSAEHEWIPSETANA